MSQNTTPGRILGIGGVFFKTAHQDEMRAWYGRHLGLTDEGQGVSFQWRDHDDPTKQHVTVWSLFPDTSNYFDAPFMINYIVDDLDALLEKLHAAGVQIDPKREDHDYGRFAWIFDPGGNKLELWQPRQA